jgi:hypothetical protein
VSAEGTCAAEYENVAQKDFVGEDAIYDECISRPNDGKHAVTGGGKAKYTK